MADTPTGETVTPGDSQPTVQTPAAPAPAPANASDQADVERLRKEKEQADLRIRQLENEKAARDKADEEAKQQRLADNDEWKQIAEQEKAKREALENERQEAETKQALRLSEEAIFAEFSQDAIDVAKEAGLSLTEDSDSAKEAFKSRMQKISEKVVSTPQVTPNNPGVTPEANDRAELVQRMRYGDTAARDQAVNGLKSLDFMRAQAGYTNEQ
jgi:hypothetical protein